MNNENRKKLSDVLFIIAFVCVIIVGVLFVRNRIQDNHSEEIMDELREQASAASPSPTAPPSASPTQAPAASPTQSPAASPAATPVPTPEAVVNPYREAFLSNEDMGAWLQIPGTEIDYPVMWTPEDEEYYLYRGFDGSENKNGSLILDTDSCLNPLTTNLIIHGHNMKSGAMFGCLTDYEDESYYQEHKDIILYTEECQRNYEVIAVFRSQVFRKSDDVFKFYNFFQADTQEEFDDFYNNIKEMSLYDTGVTAEFGDRFITLSTCVYHVETGRFVVVAKEVEGGNTYLPLSE
ncbi:MAG: sortase [Lachnospiraceae bacterium]|nr:sortase [Lachnospiraceae bacterium]MCI9674616.1 sortase [Lachnospiraceae bacterium]